MLEHKIAQLEERLLSARVITKKEISKDAVSIGSRVLLRDVKARTLLIAFSSDWLYPPEGSEELAAALGTNGLDVELHVIEAPYGHDCFLLEEARQTPIIRRFLEGPP